LKHQSQSDFEKKKGVVVIDSTGQKLAYIYF